MQTLNGKQLAKQVLSEISEQTAALGRSPKLAIVMSGDNPASEVYVRKKMETAADVGIETRLVRPDTTEADILEVVRLLGDDDSIDGIIVQLPLPGIDATDILAAIPAHKDVDGLNPLNLGKLYNGIEAPQSATPLAVMYALDHIASAFDTDLRTYLTGKHAVIINRSILFGKPLAAMLLHNDATVTMAHSRTRDLQSVTQTAEILITATGRKNLITADHISNNAVVIDAGFSKDADGIFGDVNKDSVAGKASWLSPVPGGIGPLGVAMLMRNTLNACLTHLKQ